MTKVLLIYPFFKPRRDRSVFRFPPLGLGYIAASLQGAGHSVSLLDCTFMIRDEAMNRAVAEQAQVVGIYCMVTLEEDCLRFARKLRDQCQLLIVGGPLPTCDPITFLDDFDVIVRGEGEQTVLELLQAWELGEDWSNVAGIAFRQNGKASRKSTGGYIETKPRAFARDLDRLPSPTREMFPNEGYIRYGRKKYGYSITSVMSTRGCPFHCDFCSNVVFGNSYRQRSVYSVVDEVEAALDLGYDRIAFADDVFTLNRRRVFAFCEEIRKRGLHFQWECLGRVDTMDYETALAMKEAGCSKIFFGIESGDDRILELMKKQITSTQARETVEAVHRAGLQVGAFFILFYPGDTDETVLETLRFATSLPLDYLGLTLPYPLPGTGLYKRMNSKINRTWRPKETLTWSHMLIYDSDFSEFKMWFGILKGHIQFRIKRYFGRVAPLFLVPFEKLSDQLLKLIK